MGVESPTQGKERFMECMHDWVTYMGGFPVPLALAATCLRQNFMRVAVNILRSLFFGSVKVAWVKKEKKIVCTK